MLIYISHPYGNKEENKKDVERIVEELLENNPRDTYISPIHTFGYLYEKVDYNTGLEMCLDLLKLCNLMLVYGDYRKSEGCTKEIQYARSNRIPYQIMK